MVRVKLNTAGTVIRLTAGLCSIQPVYQEYITIQRYNPDTHCIFIP